MTKELAGETGVDFDGTFTNAEKEAETANASYDEMMANEVGIGLNELREMLEIARQEIIKKPGIFGWIHNGLIVAPATSDPYILHQTSVSLVVDKLRKDTRNLSLPSKDEFSNFQNRLFSLSYPDSGTHFKPGAKDFIQELQALGEPIVITNSQTQAVMKKLNLLLGEDHDLQVVGNAKKYVVDLSYTEVGESVRPTTKFPRPVFLRRPNYHKTLEELGDIRYMIGDIYELDLVLPENMGTTTVLVTNPMTPDWEQDYYKDHPNGFATDTLENIIPELLNRN